MHHKEHSNELQQGELSVKSVCVQQWLFSGQWEMFLLVLLNKRSTSLHPLLQCASPGGHGEKLQTSEEGPTLETLAVCTASFSQQTALIWYGARIISEGVTVGGGWRKSGLWGPHREQCLLWITQETLRKTPTWIYGGAVPAKCRDNCSVTVTEVNI